MPACNTACNTVTTTTQDEEVQIYEAAIRCQFGGNGSFDKLAIAVNTRLGTIDFLKRSSKHGTGTKPDKSSSRTVRPASGAL